MSLKKIAWGEAFIMYVYVDWKLANKVVRTLTASGFEAEIHQSEISTDDRTVTVRVTPLTAHVACYIIKSIIQ